MARRRINGNEFGACEEEDLPVTLDCSRHWRGVAGLVDGGFPHNLTGGFVERGYACSLSPADIQEDLVAIYERRARRSEKPFSGVPFFLRVHAPEFFAGGKVQAMEHP